MPSTYSKNLGLELIQTGEQPGTWGETTNLNFKAIDDGINGMEYIPLGATGAIVTIDRVPALGPGRAKILIFTGPMTAEGTVSFQPNDSECYFFVKNESNYPLRFQQGSGSQYTVAAGYSAVVHCNGAGSGASCYGALCFFQCNKLLVRADALIPGATGEAMIEGNATVGGTLNVTGGVTLSGSATLGALTVTGNSTLTGAVSCGSTLTVAGVATLQSNLGVGGTLAVAGVSTLVGSVACGADLAVSGAVTFVSTMSASGQITAGGGLQVNIPGGDAAYDMYYRSAAGPLARLANGAAGLYLRASASGPAWQGLSIAAGTPFTGGVDGDVPFVLNNTLTRSPRLNFKYATSELIVKSEGAAASRLSVDSELDGKTNAVSLRQAGKGRIDFGLSGADGHLAFGRFDDNGNWLGVTFVYTRTGRMIMGATLPDMGATLNLTPYGPAGTPLIIRRELGQTGHLTVWQNEGGGLLSYIDKDGKYVAVGTTASWVYVGRTSAYFIATNSDTGGLFYYNPQAGTASVYGGYLNFGYRMNGNPTGFAGSVYCVLPDTGGGSPTPVVWYHLGNGQPPRKPIAAELEEIQRAQAAATLESILAQPDLVQKLKERLAA